MSQKECFKDGLSSPLWVNSLMQAIVEGTLQIKDTISIFQLIIFLVEISQKENVHSLWNSFDDHTTYKHISFENSGVIQIPYNFTEILDKINDLLNCQKYFNNPFTEQICSQFFTLNSEFSSLKSVDFFICDIGSFTDQINRFFRFILCSCSSYSIEKSTMLIKEAYELITSEIHANLKIFCLSVLKNKLCTKTVFDNFDKVLCKNFTKEISLFYFIKDLAIKEFLSAVDINRETIETYF